jgi:hypothetical protein
MSAIDQLQIIAACICVPFLLGAALFFALFGIEARKHER